MKALAWSVAVVIAALNAWLLYQTFAGFLAWIGRLDANIDATPAQREAN